MGSDIICVVLWKKVRFLLHECIKSTYKLKNQKMDKLTSLKEEHTYILVSQDWFRGKVRFCQQVATHVLNNKERHQKAESAATHGSHPPAEEPTTSVISGFEICQGITHTHLLVSQWYMWWACWKYKRLHSHTAWRAKDRCVSRVKTKNNTLQTLTF